MSRKHTSPILGGVVGRESGQGACPMCAYAVSGAAEGLHVLARTPQRLQVCAHTPTLYSCRGAQGPPHTSNLTWLGDAHCWSPCGAAQGSCA